MNQPKRARELGSEIVLYETEDGSSRIEVRLEGETVWLTINQMAELFQVDKSGISRHLGKIYDTGELQREATVAKYATVQKEGERRVSRELEYYNLDAIISVGYRVNSIRGTERRFLLSKISTRGRPGVRNLLLPNPRRGSARVPPSGVRRR